MKIHYVIGAYPPSVGGAQIHTARLIEELVHCHRIEATVSTHWRETRRDWVRGSTIRLPSGSEVTRYGPAEIRTVGLTGRRRVRDPFWSAVYYANRRRAAAYFARHLAFSLGDVDAAHVVRLGREHLALRAFEDARRSRVPTFLTPNHHARWSKRPDPVWRELYRRAAGVFALTPTEASALTDLGVRQDRITVTGVGPVLANDEVNSEAILGHLRIDARPFLLFLGQQYPYKGTGIAIRAFDAIAPRFPDLALVIAGPTSGYTEQARRRARHEARVHVLGSVDLEEKTALLERAEALVLPSSQEAFGGVLVEAAYCGTPYVTTDVAALADVHGQIKFGLSVPRTVTDLAGAMEKVLQTDWSSRREAARDAVERHYGWTALAKRYHDAYRSVLGA